MNQYDSNTKLYSILAYLGLLFLVGIFADPQNPKVKFHCNQGLILVIVEVILWIAISILSAIIFAISWTLSLALSPILWLAYAVVAIGLSVMGIINVTKGEEKRLPVIGKFDILK